MLSPRAILNFASRLTPRRRLVPRKVRGRRVPRFESLEDRSLLTGFWVSGATVHESEGYAIFMVGGLSSNGDPISVEYQTVDGSAVAGSDYGAASGTLSFAQGFTVEVSVSIVDDVFTEDDESFSLELFNPVNAPVDIPQAAAMIRINDRPPVLDPISDQTVDEGQELTFCAWAYDPDDAGESIAYSLDSGAPSGAAIDSSSGTFTWLPQEADGPGTFQVTVRATESLSGMSATATLTITVNEVNAAPTTTGLSDVSVDEDASDTVIDLWSAFDDAEDGASNLSYSIVGNSDPSLFSSVSIDANGQLTLAYAANAWGWSTLTVRATDSGGLSIETELGVGVDAVNDAPIVSGFTVNQVTSDSWIVSGHVSDVDDDVTGWSVYFGGVLMPFSVSASVDSWGDFATELDLAGIQSANAEAWVFDLDGLQSNIAISFV